MVTETISCAAPFCGKEIPVTGEWVQLDIPLVRFLAFCDLRCLHVWTMHHAVTGFREITTQPQEAR